MVEKLPRSGKVEMSMASSRNSKTSVDKSMSGSRLIQGGEEMPHPRGSLVKRSLDLF